MSRSAAADRELIADVSNGNRGRIAILVTLGVITTACVQSGPLLIAWAVDHALGENGGWIAIICAAAYFAVNVAGAGLSALQLRMGSRITEDLLYRMRVRLFGRMLDLDATYFERTSDGSILSRLTGDVEIVAIFLRSNLVAAMSNLLVLIVTTVFLFVLSPPLALIVLGCVVPLALIRTRRFVLHARSSNDGLREAAAAATGELNEGVRGIAVVRRFGRDGDQIARYESVDERRLGAASRSYHLAARYSAEIDALGVLAYLPVVLGGAFLLDRGVVSAGAIVGFVVYVGSFFDPVQNLTHVLAQAQAARSAVGRIAALAAEPVQPPPPKNPVQMPRTGELTLENVWFGYGIDAPALLQDFTVRLPAGSRVALVGASGAGKTTVARLLSRTLVPDRGSARYGGADLRSVTRNELRSRIISVAQEGHLFSGSTAENLSVTGASEAEVHAMLARLHKLGLGSHDNRRLSAGQRQLIALGRALLLDPSVLILDEATADVDEDIALAVDELLADLRPDCTVLVVVHRMETAMRMERALVIADGAVVQDGAPAELAAEVGPFRTLVERERSSFTSDTGADLIRPDR
ncbi:ABC transporter ATP-binding protein [Rhodococcus globerulus]|uniref:ABC transporter ATP-binding protein n=1 Tax=Rhodococcus globerulus TaxID=33008 RepID=A0ABU4C5V6_RHOGO|nr:ABC transporter ATP-binding protein [Rhodococcus globerulus]MDV6271646.1 ABC transporter ATP-binding protein [Rhodococcus globerulus]